ncbi:hypothetical protein HYV72_01485, partial [Candidatus Uhrbacteria bacterium]|nr:hypothetical protein [Candidatus Uhrbacteria bacterium]
LLPWLVQAVLVMSEKNRFLRTQMVNCLVSTKVVFLLPVVFVMVHGCVSIARAQEGDVAHVAVAHSNAPELPMPRLPRAPAPRPVCAILTKSVTPSKRSSLTLLPSNGDDGNASHDGWHPHNHRPASWLDQFDKRRS